MPVIDSDYLIKYAYAHYNVLLTGKHGVGKTAMIKEVFTEVFGEYGKKWLYFSASTMDPWVDFIGIPKNYTNADGQEVFRIIPPEQFTGNNEIEALVFDEVNRADEKTLNGIMELIQFKSINGRPFPHLKCIWAAENPHDDEDGLQYSVKPLDPAQRDRFQVQLRLPYELSREYMVDKFGLETFEIANAWWQGFKNKVSPRKLDDMLLGFQNGFELADFVGDKINVSELETNLRSVHELKAMKDIVDNGAPADIKRKFSVDYLRKNEGIIKRDKGHHVVSKIYDHVNEELQDYIRRTFGYIKPALRTTDSMTTKQVTFINNNEEMAEENRYFFNTNNMATILRYLDNYRDQMHPVPSGVNFSAMLEGYFPFRFDDNFKQSDIAVFLKQVDNSGLSDTLKMWFQSSMKVLNSLGVRTDMPQLDLMKLVTRLAGTKSFTDQINLNKITFNKLRTEIIGGNSVFGAEVFASLDSRSN